MRQIYAHFFILPNIWRENLHLQKKLSIFARANKDFATSIIYYLDNL
jgi:hypothetical protein